MKVDLNPTKHLSSLPRRRKWKFSKKPKRIKTKNYLYSLSDINIPTVVDDLVFHSQFQEKIEVEGLNLSCLDRVFMAENDMEKYTITNEVTMDGWELPFFNEFEDTSCYMVCPDRNLIDLSEDNSISIIDFISTDAYALNNTVKTGLSYKEVKKLHRAMWHSKAEHLQRWLIKNDWSDEAKSDAKALITKVLRSFKTCKPMKQPHGRPKDFGIKAEFPNEVVVMDQAFLKDEDTSNSYPFLHMMDVATRWSLVHTITRRGGNVGGFDVIKAMFLWEQLWGSPPQVLFSDRGREFINSRVLYFCQERNIIQLTSPVRKPASNGLIERNNGVLKQIAYRLARGNRRNLQDDMIDFQDILFSACAAKNSMVGKLGYSAQYLAFLNNHLCISEISPDKQLPALSLDLREERPSAERQVRCHQELRQEARRIVYDKLNKDQTERILRERLRPVPDHLPEDSLCDITDESGTGRDWIGPCTVIKHDRRMVYVKVPGGTVQQVHRHRVRPREIDGKIEMEVVPVDEKVVEDVKKEDSVPDDPDFKNLNMQSSDNAFKRDVDNFKEYDPVEKFDGEEAVLEPQRALSVPAENREPEAIEVERRKPGRPKSKASPDRPKVHVPKKRGRPKKDLSAVPLKTLSELLDDKQKVPQQLVGKRGKHDLSRILRSRMNTDTENISTGVMTRAQRKKLIGMILRDTGSNNDIANIFVTKDDVKLKECKDGPEFDEPKKKEWKAWQDNEGFVWVKDEGQPRVRCRWVLTKRRVFPKKQLVKLLNEEIRADEIPTVLKLKARLTPQGTHNQDPDRENIECESPTANKLNIRLLLSRAAILDWEIETFDVSTAFLQQLPIEELEGMWKRELYVLPPKEFKRDGYLMHMKKAAYGFADAPRRWLMTSDKILKQIGFKSSSGDPATYYLQTEEKETRKMVLNGMLCLNVDDGLSMCRR